MKKQEKEEEEEEERDDDDEEDIIYINDFPFNFNNVSAEEYIAYMMDLLYLQNEE